MKNLAVLTLLSLAFCSTAFAAAAPTIECRVYKMSDLSYFEEGLSAEEYPDVEVNQTPSGEWTVKYGSHRTYTKKEGFTVTVVEDKGDILVTSKSPEGDVITLKIEPRTVLADATIRIREESSTKFHTLGRAICITGLVKGVNSNR